MSNAEEIYSSGRSRFDAGSSVNKNVFVKLLALLTTFASVSSLNIYHLYKEANADLKAGQDKTLLLNSFLIEGTTSNFAYGVFLSSRDSNGITCNVNVTSFAWGDTTTFGSATGTRTISNALCYSSYHGNYHSDMNRLSFLTLNGVNVGVGMLTPGQDGSMALASQNYTASSIGSYANYVFALPIRETNGQTNRLLLLNKAQSSSRIFRYTGRGTAGGYTGQFRLRGNTTALNQNVNYYGADCTISDGASGDFCMFWGQTDAQLGTKKATINIRRASGLPLISATATGILAADTIYYKTGADVLGDYLPYSCVIRDQLLSNKPTAYCVLLKLSDNTYSSVILDLTGFLDGPTPNPDTLDKTADFATMVTTAPATLDAPYRMVKVKADGSEVIMIKDDGTPVRSIFVCIMDQTTAFCDPSNSAKSTEVPFQTNTPDIVNPALFKVTTVKYQGADIMRVFYETVENQQITMATLYRCDDATNYNFNPVNVATNPCHDNSAVTGYRLNSDIYAYEACTVANCDKCDADISGCETCAAGHTKVIKDGVTRCTLASTPGVPSAIGKVRRFVQNASKITETSLALLRIQMPVKDATQTIGTAIRHLI